MTEGDRGWLLGLSRTHQQGDAQDPIGDTFDSPKSLLLREVKPHTIESITPSLRIISVTKPATDDCQPRPIVQLMKPSDSNSANGIKVMGRAGTRNVRAINTIKQS